MTILKDMNLRFYGVSISRSRVCVEFLLHFKKGLHGGIHPVVIIVVFVWCYCV